MLTPINFQLSGLRAHKLLMLGSSPFLGGQNPLPSIIFTITGVTRDSTGVALGNCVCTLFNVNTNGTYPTFIQTDVTISDGSGNFSFNVGSDGPWRVIFDQEGSPILAGITLMTLSGV